MVKCTEIFNKKYKIIDKSNIEIIDNNNTDIIKENTPTKKSTLIHSPDVIDHNIENWQEVINTEEIDAPALETDNEEINISPQTKKRLQQQARLNLVVNSDSSESDDECVTNKTSRKQINSLDTNRCNKDDKLKNDTNYTSKQTVISRDEDIYISKEATLVPTEVNLDSTNMKEEIKKTPESLTRHTYENNDLFQSATSKNLLKKAQYYENVHNDDRSENDSFKLRISEINDSCNNEESMNQFPRHKQSPLFKKNNVYTKCNENKEMRDEFETRHKSVHEQSAQALTKSCSNTHLNISCQHRPCNVSECK